MKILLSIAPFLVSLMYKRTFGLLLQQQGDRPSSFHTIAKNLILIQKAKFLLSITS